MPFVSLGLAHAEAPGTDAPWCSTHPKAGTGGRTVQLEKIGALPEAPSQTNQCKGSTSLSSNIPINPQAPEPTRSRKGQKIVQRNIPKKFSKNTVIGHTAARSVAPPTTGFSDQMLDPALRDTNRAEFQLTGVHSGTDEEDREDDGDKDNEDDEDDGDDPGDDPNDGDEENVGPEEEMREQEIGWGEGRAPFVYPLPPSRCLMPDFKFIFSHDEDDMGAQGLLDSVRGVQQIQDAEDVLRRHHDKNGQPRLPDPDTLELLHQVTESDKLTQCSRIRRSDEPKDGPKPTQLAWYGPRWKTFLEDAKGECRTEHALENPFPTLVQDLPVVLVVVLVAWDQDGKQFEAGIWPEQKPNMARLLYDDLATWRSDLKKCAISIAPIQYSLIPPPSIPAQQHAGWIETAAVALLANSLFLRHGVDNMEYGPIYCKMLNLLKDILKDHYHGPILLAQLWEWAQVGWTEISKVDGAVESRHDLLQIILD
ncbi:hypothetical protein DEU56DRAFT_757673 [Suillus clintonianus]|uniref:uncharacterized protein n=1 Tax=Suillus clintonianus TaxID=1904413 RepID=UPI001B873FD7|nr:uncharacterized protein DEU56DRAFT_757673 [Suillus clintonianus]KAG2131046.1 hypothetical protein DEU56DRAFT_757673 [Suillus clintonianus]